MRQATTTAEEPKVTILDEKTVANAKFKMSVNELITTRAACYLNTQIGTTRTVIYGKTINRIRYTNTNTAANTTINGGADTSLLGGDGWTFLEQTMRKANVQGCSDGMVVRNLPIRTAVVAYDTTKGGTLLLLVNEAIDHKQQAGFILSVN